MSSNLRILVKGGSIEGVNHKEVGWKHPTNAKDNDIVFLNLDTILDGEKDLVSPESDVPQSLEFPNPNDIIKLIESDKEIFVFLPTTRDTNMTRVADGSTDKKEVDLLSWLPFEINTTEEPGTSVRRGTVDKGWEWYFNEDFEWPMYINRVSLKSDQLSPQGLFDRVEARTIAETAFQEDIAIELKVQWFIDAVSSSKENEAKYSGSVFLLPLRPNYCFDEVASQILSTRYGLEVTKSKPKPEWTEDFLLPRQQKLIEKSREIHQEFESLKEYKKLLYDTGDSLEQTVLDSFRYLGIETKPEIAGKRDGVILLNEEALVLEIHGTENAIGVKKIEQLNRWVRNTVDEFPDKKVVGLLVMNAHRDQLPKNRPESLVGDPRKEMEELDYKAIRTKTIYDWIGKFQQGELSCEDIRKKLSSDSLYLE